MIWSLVGPLLVWSTAAELVPSVSLDTGRLRGLFEPLDDGRCCQDSVPERERAVAVVFMGEEDLVGDNGRGLGVLSEIGLFTASNWVIWTMLLNCGEGDKSTGGFAMFSETDPSNNGSSGGGRGAS